MAMLSGTSHDSLAFASLCSWPQLLAFVSLLLLALLNVKVLPFAWHIRVFYRYFKNYYFDHRPLPPSTSDAPTLFQATIHTNSTPLWEIDYNLHKSNSTYLTDLDIARGLHVYCLFRVGLHKFNSPNAPAIPIPDKTSRPLPNGISPNTLSKSTPRGPFYPALGGVTCTFRREIPPYVTYEIWTRVLSWDTKWVYLISHFVKKGSGNPVTYSDQPWRVSQSKKGSGISISKEKAGKGDKTAKQPVIYASCVSKYVFKKGRVTVPPTTFLEACGLLPPVESSNREGNEVDDEAMNVLTRKREEGLTIAQGMANLDQGLEFFSSEDETVFAEY